MLEQCFFKLKHILTKLLANSVVVDWTIFLTLDKDLSITAEEQTKRPNPPATYMK